MLRIAVFCIHFNVSDDNAYVSATDRWCIMQMHGFENTAWTENISCKLRNYFAMKTVENMPIEFYIINN